MMIQGHGNKPEKMPQQDSALITKDINTDRTFLMKENCINAIIPYSHISAAYGKNVADAVFNPILNKYPLVSGVTGIIVSSTLENILNKEFWMPEQALRDILDNSRKETKNETIAFECGVNSYKYRALGIQAAAMLLLPAKIVVSRIPIENAKYNKNKEFIRVKDLKKYSATIEFRFEDSDIANEDFCEYTRGIYISLGNLMGRPIQIEQTRCQFHGNDYCRMEFEWGNEKLWSRIKKAMVYLLGKEVIEELYEIRTNNWKTIQSLENVIHERTSELRSAYETLKETQEELVRQEVAKAEREKELQTEKAMSGGLAHEGRNALMPAAIQIRRLMEYQEKQSAFDILSSKSGSLLNQIMKIENEFNIPQELVNKDIIPIFREINDLIKDINKTTEEISTGVGKGLGLIDLFRTYSKTQEMTRGVETIDVAKIAHDLGETYKKRLSESGTSYTVTVTYTEPVITGDYLHIESIVKNLFLNALDALEKAEQKKIDITISKVIKADIPYLRITVADTGEGIPADQYDKIFQAFYTTKSAKGTGLGLSIVKRLVEIYDGSIAFESEIGRGTTFMVDLKY
ncbi:MAG: ATP-binding protein [archaeon]